MVLLKSHVRRRFKPNHYPENVCFDSDEIYKKFDRVDLNENEEVWITIDNEPNSNQTDGVMFTSDRIIILVQDSVESVPWEQIETLQLPQEKLRNDYVGNDRKMMRSDKAKLHLKDGRSLAIRIICGGIYQLASLVTKLREGDTSRT